MSEDMKYKLLPMNDGTYLALNDHVIWKRYNKWKFYVYVILNLFSFGFLHVLCKIRPVLKSRLLTSECDPSLADTALVFEDDDWRVTNVEHYEIQGFHIVSIEVNSKRYFASSANAWKIEKVPDVPHNFYKYLSSSVVDPATRQLEYAYYGPNKMQLPDSNFWDILTVTIVHPFYIFQYFSVALWMIENYFLYSLVILFITAGSVYLTTSETLYNLHRLHDLAGKSFQVNYLDENDEIQQISDTELVPGDRLVITEGTHLPCDALLISGRVSVDESMLTGESVPVTKTPVETTGINPSTDFQKRSGNILYSGTRVLLCTHAVSSVTNSPDSVCPEKPRHTCVAVVYRTGFRSAKGQLVAALLNPKDEFLSFFSDAMWVVLVMVIACTGLYMWSATSLRHYGTSWQLVIVSYLDALTTAVPAALTASLTVATGISIGRLKDRGIFVSETSRVNWAGLISTVCFDKTGTLTEESLNFKGMVIPDKLCQYSIELPPESSQIPTECVELMATCHGLAVIDTKNVGDPLEVELFRATGYFLNVSPSGHLCAFNGPISSITCYEILRQFEFTPDKLRAGSLVRKPDGCVVYFVKGSPETILKLVRSSSLPSDVHAVLARLSRRGFRVIAMASSAQTDSAVAMTSSQSDLESNLTFLGFLFLSNALKSETVSTIATLGKAKIQCSMITGDHIFTAVAIATDCGLIQGTDVYIVDVDSNDQQNVQVVDFMNGERLNIGLQQLLTSGMNAKVSAVRQGQPEMQLAVTGNALETIRRNFPKSIPDLIYVAKVFARMKPSEKEFIVQELLKTCEIVEDQIDSRNNFSVSEHSIVDLKDNDRGKMFVMFCGDGANDMAALRAATVGVSLCEAETSVAAPVTSRLQTPGAVIETMKEGRCSLITAYVLVAFTIMFANIQTFMICVLYSYGLRIGNYTYLIQDLFFTLVLALAVSWTPPHSVLGVEIPPQRFFTKYFCVKLLFQVLSFPFFQYVALGLMTAQDWYEKYEPHENDPLVDTYAYETTVITYLGLSQVMIASVAASIDEPFRKPWYTNRFHVFCLTLQAIFLVSSLFMRANDFTRDVLQLKPLPYQFCGYMLAIIAANCITAHVIARIADYIRLKNVRR